MQQIKNKKSRFTLFVFLGLFTLPVIAAWIAYFSGWFSDINTTNKGEWVKPIINFQKFKPVYSDDMPLKMQPDESWKIILPEAVNQCQNEQQHAPCIINLYMVNQAHTALGILAERVEMVLYNGDAIYNAAQLEILQKRFIDLRIINGLPTQTMKLPTEYIYIADPLGNIMLRYPRVKSQQEAFIKGGDILKDLKKLLKLSRIG